MSVSMTLDAVRARTKTVTRRREDTWRNLKVGDRLTLIEKGMGLPKGAKQVVVVDVEITDVRIEPITHVLTEPDATAREGLPQMTPDEFVTFWLKGHGYHPDQRSTECCRIEWRYLDDDPLPASLFSGATS